MTLANHSAAGRRSWGSMWVRLTAVTVVLSLSLTACTDGEENRQFATDSRRSGEPTATMVVTPPPPPPTMKETVIPARPLTDLVVSRGAPDTVYLRANKDLLAVSAPGGAVDVFAPGADEAIVGSSASPSGDRVAVLTVTREGASAVTVVDASGKRIIRWDNLGAAFEAGADRTLPLARSIDWSPQGDRLLAGFEPGGIVELPVRGDATPTIAFDADAAPWPVIARWSPTGQRIAYISAPQGNATSGLIVSEPDPAGGGQGGGASTPAVSGTPVATPAATPIPDLAPIAGGSGRSVLNFAWMPDGQSLLFTEGSAVGGQPSNADLWRIGADGKGRKLVASAGSAAPVANVTLIAPSPDGRAAAYTVTTPDQAGERFHSLWVRDLASGSGYQIPVDSESAVTDIRWTSAGLLYRTVPQALNARNYQGGDFDVFVIGGDGSAKLLMTARVASGTPEATPIGAE